jgi:hypothetical protein
VSRGLATWTGFVDCPGIAKRKKLARTAIMFHTLKRTKRKNPVAFKPKAGKSPYSTIPSQLFQIISSSVGFTDFSRNN